MAKPDLIAVKQRFGIIGNAPGLNRALDIALQVAPTDLSVLITGESGVGKENFPQIIHQYSHRKHAAYIAVNCGAIPEGTIDSELFGHEKGSFTGALSDRKGYFEFANNGTIFLDEVGELPLPTQARLLRVLETGEYMKVGSSKVEKTNVRIVAATNVNMVKAIEEGKFREDLFYRLSTVPVQIPPLRERGDDIFLLFRKFAADFSSKYRMPAIQLTDDAKRELIHYPFPGNVRQLKNITEQISIIETSREIDSKILAHYLPVNQTSLIRYQSEKQDDDHSFAKEREIIYKILFDMKKEVNDLKTIVQELIGSHTKDLPAQTIMHSSESNLPAIVNHTPAFEIKNNPSQVQIDHEIEYTETEDIDNEIKEGKSLEEIEKEIITRVLAKYNGKRKPAANELKISERTLYRKIKEFGLDDKQDKE
ncbi:MAG: sigma-54 interaction domain-containing protein [Bacteroidales bacterium]